MFDGVVVRGRIAMDGGLRNYFFFQIAATLFVDTGTETAIELWGLVFCLANFFNISIFQAQWIIAAAMKNYH